MKCSTIARGPDGLDYVLHYDDGRPGTPDIPEDLPRFVPCHGCSGGVAALWHWQHHNGLTTYRCPDCGWKVREYASDLIEIPATFDFISPEG